jgi:hypothetical protein
VRNEAIEAVKAAPPVGYIAGTLAGLTWSEWASIAALVYTLWLLAEKVWRVLGPRIKAWRANRGP